MLVVVVACLVLAVAITLIRGFGGGGGGMDDISKTEIMWVKCVNPKCNAGYETPTKEYYLQQRKRADASESGQASLAVCEKCGKESVMTGMKCEKCENVFVSGGIRDDFHDRCPKCKYSATEERQNKPQ